MQDEIQQSNIVTAIDIGTEKIKVLVGRVQRDRVELLGRGDELTNRSAAGGLPQKNVWKGTICNFDAVREKLRTAIHEAEEDAGVVAEDTHLCVAIGGDKLGVEFNDAEMPIAHENGIVTSEDVVAVNRAARERFADSQLDPTMCELMTCNRYFSLEDGRFVVNATGQVSRKLRAYLQYIVCRKDYFNALRGMIREVVNADSVDFFYYPFIPGYVARHCYPSEDGFLTIDIGAGVTSFTVNSSECYPFIGQLPVGCIHIENDLRLAFGIDETMGRRILREFSQTLEGSLSHPDDQRERMVDVEKREGRGARQVPLSSVEKVISLRMEELFTVIKEQLESQNVLHYAGRLALLSGGGSLIPGVEDVASRVFGHPCRRLQYNGLPIWDDTQGLLKDDARQLMVAGLFPTYVRVEREREYSRMGQSNFGRLLRTLLNMD